MDEPPSTRGYHFMELPGSSVSPTRCQSHVLRFLRMMVVLKEVATALAYMHSNEITHNDMKCAHQGMASWGLDLDHWCPSCTVLQKYVHTHAYIYIYTYVYTYLLLKKVLALYPRIMNPDHLVAMDTQRTINLPWESTVVHPCAQRWNMESTNMQALDRLDFLMFNAIVWNGGETWLP